MVNPKVRIIWRSRKGGQHNFLQIGRIYDITEKIE